MRTSDLIDCLVGDPLPRTMRLTSRFWLALGLGVLAAAVLFMVGVGPRSDFVMAMHTLRFDLKFVETLSASFGDRVPMLSADAPGRAHRDARFVPRRTFPASWNGGRHRTVSCAVRYLESKDDRREFLEMSDAYTAAFDPPADRRDLRDTWGRDAPSCLERRAGRRFCGWYRRYALRFELHRQFAALRRDLVSGRRRS